MKKASVTPAFRASASTAVLSLPPENETFAQGRSSRCARIVRIACRSRFLRWCRFRSTTTSQPGSSYRFGATGTSSRTLSRPPARTPVPYRPRYFTSTGPSGSVDETSTRLPPSRTLAPAKAGSASRSTTPFVAAPTSAGRAPGSGSNRWHRSTGSNVSQPNRSPFAITSSFRSVPPVLFSRRTCGSADRAEAFAHERRDEVVVGRERGADVVRLEERRSPPLVAGRAPPAEQGDVVLGAPVEGLLHDRRLGPPAPALSRRIHPRWGGEGT